MRIFITGSADGLGQGVARMLLNAGHQVVLHARNSRRAADAKSALPAAETVLTGDLSSIAETRALAAAATAAGPFDTVIHNAGLGYQEPSRATTADGLPQLFAVNTLAPYILTALMPKPARLIYLASGLIRMGDTSLQDLTWEKRKWVPHQAYADSKIHDLMLALAVARHWPEVCANAVDPGWVPTKMGGTGAPDSLADGCTTQAWLAVSNDPAACVSGRLFHHKFEKDFPASARDTSLQDGLLAACARISGVAFPS